MKQYLISERNAEKTVLKNSKAIVYIALFSVLITVCSWISIPTTIPFTLQTFAVFCALLLLGGKNGTISIIIYILLGLIGIPVFSGFKGGIGVLLGVTGGYIAGFVLSGLIFWLITSVFKKNLLTLIVAMILGLIVTYAFGTAWFITVYTKNVGSMGLLSALSLCVFPFIIPDLIKIFLALTVANKFKKFVVI